MNERKPRRIVLAGGSGQVGTLLARHFHSIGDSVVVLSRYPKQAQWRTASWDAATAGDWIHELDGADLLINLAGRSVNCRYTRKNRQEIVQSRIQSTRILGEVIHRAPRPPRIWMNASTATIYRHSLDRPMDELTGEICKIQPAAPSSWNFSINVATRWEEAFLGYEISSMRKIALRSAMVMSPDRGGIFDTLLRLVRFGLGGSSGSGKQYVSWIHEADFIRAIEFLIAHEELSGCVNLASPNPLPNRKFMETIRQAWGTRFGLPATESMLEIGAFFLRTESELILKSRRVIPGRLLRSGFEFNFAEWHSAASQLVERWRENSWIPRAGNSFTKCEAKVLSEQDALLRSRD